MGVATDPGTPPQRGHLGQHLVHRPGRVGAVGAVAIGHLAAEQAGPEVALLRVLAQPVVAQHLESLGRTGPGPVELGGEVVEPALAAPALHIGIQLVELAEALDARRTQAGLADAEGADAHLEPGLDAVHLAVQRLDQAVDVVAAPVVARQPAATAAVGLPAGVIGEGAVLALALAHRVGIEIVIDVHTVDVVAARHVADHRQGVAGGVGFAGVEPALVTVDLGQRGLAAGQVLAGQR